MKVAIVGLAPSTHGCAPWNDETWELWGLPWDTFGWPFFARTFEPHDMRDLVARPNAAAYLERLADCAPYMQEQYDNVPGCKRYPREEVAKTTGAYWSSSIAYAMALAIHEGAEEIALWGVDMAEGTEYACQKANMEYLIGLARGRGITVHIPEESALCKWEREPGSNHVERYGWLG